MRENENLENNKDIFPHSHDYMKQNDLHRENQKRALELVRNQQAERVALGQQSEDTEAKDGVDWGHTLLASTVGGVGLGILSSRFAVMFDNLEEYNIEIGVGTGVVSAISIALFYIIKKPNQN